MKKDEAEALKWAGYQLDAPVDDKLFEEALGVFDSIEERRPQNDLVNWDERKAMDEATKRSGSQLFSESEVTEEDRAEMQSIKRTVANKPPTPEELEKQELNEETQDQPKPKAQMEDGEEIDLVAYGADLVEFMENNEDV